MNEIDRVTAGIATPLCINSPISFHVMPTGVTATDVPSFAAFLGSVPTMSVGSWRTGQHTLGGGQTEFSPNGFGGGGGVVADIFRIHLLWGGGGSSRKYSSPGARPIRWGGVVAECFR